jgi:hypothetical protein
MFQIVAFGFSALISRSVSQDTSPKNLYTNNLKGSQKLEPLLQVPKVYLKNKSKKLVIAKNSFDPVEAISSIVSWVLPKQKILRSKNMNSRIQKNEIQHDLHRQNLVKY